MLRISKAKSYKKLAVSVVTSGLALSSWAQNNATPNIIVIFTDDQGYGDLGCYGSEQIKTPCIDSLAEKGVKFSNFYVSQAVSSASRASLLTGCYSNRVGISGALMPNSATGLSLKEETIAEILKQKGYATAMFGKWHLGDHPKFLPLCHGFDEYVGLPYSNDMWPVTYDNKPSLKKKKYPPLHLIEGEEKTKHFRSIEDQDSITTILTDKAVDFIHRKSGQPFFLYFPHPMPHVPLGVSEKYAGKSEYGRYGDVIMEIDWSVKQIVKALKENGISENTLIIFTSDNGPWMNFGTHAGTTGGFREGKGSSWEGGHRVPCVMHWPGVIPEGKTVNQLATTMDILPTLVEITGAKLPEKTIDGLSILPYLKGDTSKTIRNNFAYYYNSNDLEAVREGDWKLVFPHTYRSYLDVEPGKNGLPGKYDFKTSGIELYNLKTDPFETENVLEKYPAIVKRMQFVADSFRADLGDYLQGKQGANRRESGYTYDLNTEVVHKAVGAKANVGTTYHVKYSGGGDQALCDGKIGRPAFSDRAWQGYYGNDMLVEMEFDELTSIDSIIVGTIKNEGSWIFLPKEIKVYYSVDGENYLPYGYLNTEGDYIADIRSKYKAVFTKSVKAKAIKVEAINRKTCPEGHAAAGKPAWIFFDEILVK